MPGHGAYRLLSRTVQVTCRTIKRVIADLEAACSAVHWYSFIEGSLCELKVRQQLFSTARDKRCFQEAFGDSTLPQSVARPMTTIVGCDGPAFATKSW